MEFGLKDEVVALKLPEISHLPLSASKDGPCRLHHSTFILLSLSLVLNAFFLVRESIRNGEQIFEDKPTKADFVEEISPLDLETLELDGSGSVEYSIPIQPPSNKGPMWDSEYCQQMLKNQKQQQSGELRQDLFVYNNFFKGKDKEFSGFFIESGSAGMEGSQTLFYERCLGWSGLCIEPNSFWYPELEQGRNCKLVKSCIAANHEESFKIVDTRGRAPMRQRAGLTHLESGGDLKCYSLEQILDIYADGRREVNFWSLDVEGFEIKVIKAVNFDKIDVGVMLIEDHRINHRELSYEMTKRGMRMHYQLAGDSVWIREAENVTYVNDDEDESYQRIQDILRRDGVGQCQNGR